MADAIDITSIAAIDRDLGRLAREAVTGIERDPVAALVRFRMIGEKLADICGEVAGRPRLPDEDQYAYLKRLERFSVLDRNLLSRFHRIRLDGNQAAHEGEGNGDTARESALAAVDIAQWLESEIRKATRSNPAAITPSMSATVSSPLRLVIVLGSLALAAMVPLHGHDVRALVQGDAPLPDTPRLAWAGVQVLLVSAFAYWLFSKKGSGSTRRVVAALGALVGPGIGYAGVRGLLGQADSLPDWMWMSSTLVSQVCLLVGLRKSWEISQRKPDEAPRKPTNSTGESVRKAAKSGKHVDVRIDDKKPAPAASRPPATPPAKPSVPTSPAIGATAMPAKPSQPAIPASPRPVQMPRSPSPAPQSAAKPKPAAAAPNPSPTDKPSKPRGGSTWRA